MKAKQVHDMSDAELEAKLAELKAALFNLRFRQATHQLNNPMQLKNTKRDIARIKTVMSERARKQA